MRHKKVYVVIIVIFTVLIGVLLWYSHRVNSKIVGNNNASKCSLFCIDSVNPLELTDPSLKYKSVAAPSSEDASIEGDLNASISKDVSSGLASQVSVYFYQFNTGKWAAINPDLEYAPASMLKLPLAMAYLKLAEDTPSILSKTIFYSKSAYPSDITDFPPKLRLTPGTNYTISQLITQMIIYSGDNAMNLLWNNLDTSRVDNVFTDLGIKVPDLSSFGDIMSVKQYAVFPMALYNDSYLNDTMSERLLNLMAQADFTDGLVQGVPAGTVVAHKFGERSSTNLNVTERQLHDCGIVYSNNPYLICVMTKGKDWEGLETTIGNISSAAYADSK